MPLRLGDERVAGACQHVDRGDGLGAHGHRGHRLDAAEQVDLVRACQAHGGDGGVGDLALDQRGAGDDALDACDLGRHDGHVRAGQQRVLAAGDVGACRLDGHVLLAEVHTGQGLDLEVRERFELLVRDPADLLLDEQDVLDDLLGHPRHDLVELGLGEPVGVSGVLVELL
jgi:hypothetical protein